MLIKVTFGYTYEYDGVAYDDHGSTSYECKEAEYEYETCVGEDDVANYLLKESKDETENLERDERSWFQIGFRTAIEMMERYGYIDEDAIADDSRLMDFVRDDREGEAEEWFEERMGD